VQRAAKRSAHGAGPADVPGHANPVGATDVGPDDILAAMIWVAVHCWAVLAGPLGASIPGRTTTIWWPAVTRVLWRASVVVPWTALPAQPEATPRISGGDCRDQVQSGRTSPKRAAKRCDLAVAGAGASRSTDREPSLR
jgi:hypothetical protein